MRLNSISNINFSYNYPFHKKIRNQLMEQKEIPSYAKTLVGMDSFSLRCEDKILQMEHDGKSDTSEYADLTDFLVELKSSLALYIESILPDSHFAKHEFEQYDEEANKVESSEASDWRKKLSENMQSLYSTAGEVDTSISSDKKEIDMMKTTLREVAEQAVDEYKNSSAAGVLEKYTPSATSPVDFTSVAGMEDVKLKLYENIIQYANNPELVQQDFEDYGIKAARGFLFYGPPGCGKTFITKALSSEAGLDMYCLDVSKAGSKYVNQTSNNIKKAFDFLKTQAAKSEKPIILFMDEVDSFAMSRGTINSTDENIKTISTLLKLIEEARDNNIIVIAATNQYGMLDEAFKARFDGQMYFPLPNEEQISVLLQKTLSSRAKGVELSKSDDDIKKLAKSLKGYSNRSIVFIVDEAAKLARRNNRQDISYSDVMQALDECELEQSDEKEYKVKKSRKSAVVGFG